MHSNRESDVGAHPQKRAQLCRCRLSLAIRALHETQHHGTWHQHDKNSSQLFSDARRNRGCHSTNVVCGKDPWPPHPKHPTNRTSGIAHSVKISRFPSNLRTLSAKPRDCAMKSYRVLIFDTRGTAVGGRRPPGPPPPPVLSTTPRPRAPLRPPGPPRGGPGPPRPPTTRPRSTRAAPGSPAPRSGSC